jgi:hypothetical protein
LDLEARDNDTICLQGGEEYIEDPEEDKDTSSYCLDCVYG